MDRIDAAQLVQSYANNLLTLETIPEPEPDRDLMRPRQNLTQQQTKLRKHIQALLRRKLCRDDIPGAPSTRLLLNLPVRRTNHSALLS